MEVIYIYVNIVFVVFVVVCRKILGLFRYDERVEVFLEWSMYVLVIVNIVVVGVK